MLSHFHTSVPVLHFIAEAPIFTFLWMLEQAPSAATVFTEFDGKKNHHLLILRTDLFLPL